MSVNVTFGMPPPHNRPAPAHRFYDHGAENPADETLKDRRIGVEEGEQRAHISHRLRLLEQHHLDRAERVELLA